MPRVVSLRETSEMQRKPPYFRGQCQGAVGLVVGTPGVCFCLPLKLLIHKFDMDPRVSPKLGHHPLNRPHA